MEAARLAPSASNSQPWRFVVVDDPNRAPQVATCLQDGGINRFTENCPAFVVVIEGSQTLTASVSGTLKDQKYAAIDLGIAASHLILAATSQGLATCALGWFNERKLKILLGIPKILRIRLVIAVGYAAENDPTHAKSRKSMEEIVSYNHYNGFLLHM